jgi:hypothetical protein
MGVVGDGSGTRWGGKEVVEEVSFRIKRKCKGREDGSGQGRGGNNGDRSFGNRWWEVFYRDVGKQDMLSNFLKLKMDVGVLVLRG